MFWMSSSIKRLGRGQGSQCQSIVFVWFIFHVESQNCNNAYLLDSQVILLENFPQCHTSLLFPVSAHANCVSGDLFVLFIFTLIVYEVIV